MTHPESTSGVEWLSGDSPIDTTLESEEYVATPHRQITIGDEVVSNADLDVELTLSPTGELVFRAGVWNLRDETWARVQTGDSVDIDLGWADGGTRTVCDGVITHRASYKRRGDTFYLMHGEDVASHAISTRLADSWNNAAVGTILRDIVSQLDTLTEGFIQTGVLESSRDEEATIRREPVTLDGFTAIRRSKRVADWLDVLVEEAGRIAETEYEWYVENGSLNFHPKRLLPSKRVVLDTSGSVTRLSTVSGISSQVGNVREYQFQSLCQPELRKRSRIVLRSNSGTRLCRLVSYTFRSGVTIGEHHCTGTLVEDNARYPVEPNAPLES